jgi:hypothetical protein
VNLDPFFHVIIDLNVEKVRQNFEKICLLNSGKNVSGSFISKWRLNKIHFRADLVFRAHNILLFCDHPAVSLQYIIPSLVIPLILMALLCYISKNTEFLQRLIGKIYKIFFKGTVSRKSCQDEGTV